MKKVMMIAAIAAALVSCQSKGTQNNDSAIGEGVLTVAGNDSSAVAVCCRRSGYPIRIERGQCRS